MRHTKKVSGNSAESILFLDQSFEVMRKKGRRSLSIKLKSESYRIYANHTLPQDQILAFLNSKIKWLERNIKVIQLEKEKAIKPQFKEGALLPFQGEFKYFTFSASPQKKISFTVEDGFLICKIPQKNYPNFRADENQDKIHERLIQFYKKQASNILIQRCQSLAAKMRLLPSAVKIQTAKGRWGSCNSKKVIRLNWKLMVFPQALIDYVIVHELCHLRFLNHSQDFWNLVENFSLNYREAELAIKQHAGWTTFLTK